MEWKLNESRKITVQTNKFLQKQKKNNCFVASLENSTVTFEKSQIRRQAQQVKNVIAKRIPVGRRHRAYTLICCYIYQCMRRKGMKCKKYQYNHQTYIINKEYKV